MKKKLLSAVLSAVMVAGLVAGCGSAAAPAADAAAPAPAAEEAAPAAETSTDESAAVAATDKADADINIPFSIYSLLSPFFTAAAYGYAQEAATLGVSASLINANDNMQEQIDNVNQALSKGADALLAVPMDSDGFGTAVQACNDAGVPIYCIDRSVTNGVPTIVLQSDNVACGRAVAQGFLDKWAADGTTEVKLIQIRGQLGSSPSRDRDKGFWEVINGQTDVKVEKVAEAAADWDSSKAQDACTALLTANPDATAIFYEADCMQPGIWAALEQLGKLVPADDPNHIVNGGVDGTSFAIEAIRANTMDVCVSQRPYACGLIGELLAVHGVKYGININDYPPQLLFQTDTVTPGNIGEMTNLWGDLPLGGTELPEDLKAILM